MSFWVKMNASIEDDIASNIRISDLAAPSTVNVPVAAKQAGGPSFGAPAKVEPFLLLAKSARGAGAAKLIEEATGAPGVFVFGELLDVASIKDVRLHHASVLVLAVYSHDDVSYPVGEEPSIRWSPFASLHLRLRVMARLQGCEWYILALLYGANLIYYAAEKSSTLPALKPNQIQKLKQLSLVTLASQSRILPYSESP